jgi:SAM-dependent methyltransferase
MGTDYNPRLVEWCQGNLSFAHVGTNDLSPPLTYADGQLDLIYALSVFTHLTEELQTRWLVELSRTLKPGGHLLVSTHGDAYVHRLNEAELRKYRDGHLVVKNDTDAPGQNTCSAYHPAEYIRDHLATHYELMEFIPEGAKGNPRQDLTILRKPLPPSSN